jgi:hypothetical protein
MQVSVLVVMVFKITKIVLKPKNQHINIKAQFESPKRLHQTTFETFVISQSVFPWQAFPAYSNVCGKCPEPPIDWST